MPRARRSSPPRLTRDAERLVSLALALEQSGSRTEDRYWETQLERPIGKLLRMGNDTTLETALDHLLAHHAGAYDLLVDLCETLSESTVIEKDGVAYDVLMIVAPLAAWTRYAIPFGAIRPEALDTLHAQLHGHVLAADARLVLAPLLLSVDQMPRSFSETWVWMQKLGARAVDNNGKPVKLPLPENGEVANMLADARYVVGAVAVPAGTPMFRWQENPADADTHRAACHARWMEQAGPTFGTLLPGCGVEALLPDAWHTANREADRAVRPLSLRAAVAWLEGALTLPASQLRAVVAACGETQVDEYRIGFTPRNRNEVIYGCIWPLMGRENDGMSPGEDPAGGPGALNEIVALLKELGVTDIRRLPDLLTPEFCDDCGAPYFPDPTGDLVHAELPEEADAAPSHFH